MKATKIPSVFTLSELSLDEIRIISKALGLLPLERAARDLHIHRSRIQLSCHEMIREIEETDMSG